MSTTNLDRVQPGLEPVRKAVTVGCSPERAFEIFTGRITSWWPLDRYSISQEKARGCAIEPFTGGEIYETRDDGERFTWGQVVTWEPPGRLVITWHPGREPEVAQEVEVLFRATSGGTRVELEHRGWAKLGEGAGEVREGYEGGWAYVLEERFAAACPKAG